MNEGRLEQQSLALSSLMRGEPDWMEVARDEDVCGFSLPSGIFRIECN